MADRVTRPSNANAHPGMVDRFPTRRSKEEVEAEKQAKAMAKARAAMEKKANIDRVAALEKTEKQKANDMDREANDPLEPVTLPKAKKSRKRPEYEEAGPAETPSKKLRRDGTEISSVEGHEEAEAEAKLIAFLNEGGSSGSEFKDEGQGMEEETESEGELEDDEPDTSISIKSGGKKQKKGLIARDQVSAAVAAITDERGAANSRGGRVGTSQTPGPQLKRSKPSTPRFGLIPKWQNAHSIRTPAEVVLQANQAHGTTLGPDSDSDTNAPSWPNRCTTNSQVLSRSATTEPDEAAYHYGGYMPETAGLETFEQEGEKKASDTLKYKSITKIQEIHAAPSPRIASGNMPKKRFISYDNLPSGTKDRFKKKVIPLALETTGALKPWILPDDKAVIDIWNLVYGPEHHIEDGDVECDRFLVAKTLIKRAISSWLHKFADTAERALVAELTQQDLATKAERAQFVRRLIGNVDDLSDKKRPFLWQTAYDEPSARQEGIFQGRLVARTFLEHLQIVNTVDKNHRVQERPVGALILAVQAVHRALLYTTTGAFELPSDKKSAEFSKTNWGDYTLITPRGDKLIKRASVFLKAIKNLKEQQWADIFEVALSFSATGKQPSKSAKDEEEPISETDSDEYDELVDPRYNDVPSVEPDATHTSQK